MRNDSMIPFSRLVGNVHPHKHLRPMAAEPPSQSLRKIRDLVIFRENPAQMRNKPMRSPSPLPVVP
jgi:hypothetical protein